MNTGFKQKCFDCNESFPMDTVVCPHDGTQLNTVITGTLKGFVLADRYELKQEIGKGGMGVIYKATDKQPDDPAKETVAVKLLLNNARENEVLRSRFMVEARAASALNHPHIVKVREYSVSSEGLPFIVMDYLHGSTLDNLIASTQVDLERVLLLLMQVCDALSHAHRHNIVHRDIKPSNIIVVEENGEEKAILVDFGIAKMFTQPGKTSMHLTQTGQVFGSPLYMSPEQCMGQKLDARADIYSLGCVIYECVAGEAPFGGENMLNVIFKQINEPAPSFAASKQDKKLQAIIHKAMAKDPNNRYQNMDQLRSSLEDFLSGDNREKYAHQDFSSTTGGEDNVFLYYKRLAEAGDASAQYELSLFYLAGDYVPEDPELSLDWCTRAASQGHLEAMARLGDIFHLGEIVELDYDKAFYWYHKAAQEDHPYCARQVAAFLGEAKLMEGTPEESLAWYRRAAQLEDAEAQKVLANHYLYGTHPLLEVDIDESIKWMTRAANQGDAEAQYALGLILDDPALFENPDSASARAWFEMSAEQGHALAQHSLAWSYAIGRGTQQDDERAVYWMKEAANNGEPGAQFYLGLWLKEGNHGLKPDLKQANSFIRKAAESGDSNAQCQLAMHLLNGEGMVRNFESAMSWLKKASRQDHPEALYQLALLYKNGTGVGQSESEYFKLLRKSAELGFAEGQYELGLYHYKNKIMPQVRKWWGRAADQGHEKAKEELRDLGSEK